MNNEVGIGMEKLMKPAEYAQELGISRQAVYAKIKRGILTSKNVEGKLYIVVDTDQNDLNERDVKTTKQTVVTPKVTKASVVKTDTKDYKALLEAKDETISVLKGTVKDLKKSNKQITTTLRGEIDLLKDAFYEMRTLYSLQLEYKKSEDAIDVETEDEVTWIGIKKFFKQHEIRKEKQQEKASKRLKKAFKNGDERLMKVDGKLKINVNKNYEDILN